MRPSSYVQCIVCVNIRKPAFRPSSFRTSGLLTQDLCFLLCFLGQFKFTVIQHIAIVIAAFHFEYIRKESFSSFFLKQALSIVIFMFVCFDESVFAADFFVFTAVVSLLNHLTPRLFLSFFFFNCFLHFCQTIQRLSSQRIEECISCEIEILNAGASATARKPDFTNDLCSPGTHPSPSSTSASCISVQRGYCPQSAVVLVEKPTCLQMACVINKSYFSTIAESPSEIAADSI